MRVQFVVTVLAYMSLVDTAKLKLCKDPDQSSKLHNGLRIVQQPRSGIAIYNRTYRLSCKSSGFGRRITSWEHNGRYVDTTSTFNDSRSLRYAISDTGELMFNRFDQRDAGKYRCHIENGVCRVYSNSVTVRMHVFVEFLHPESAETTYVRQIRNTRLHLECEAVGIPTPSAAWYRVTKRGTRLIAVGTTYLNGEKLMLHKQQANSRVKVTLNVNVTQSGEYKCIATNTVVTNISRHIERVVKVTLVNQSEVNRSECVPNHVCSPCRQYLSRQPTTSPPHGNYTHMDTRCDVLTSSLPSITHTRECTHLVKRMACHIIYPQCHSSKLGPCRESCMAVSHVCLAHVSQHVRVKLVNCGSLQPEVNVSILLCEQTWKPLPLSLVTEKCYRAHGQYYQGGVNRTISGVKCQRWTATTPHNHSFTPAIYPELLGAGNRCRNPGRKQSAPWCYTSDPGVLWQPCPVPICASQPPTSHLNEHRHLVVLVVSVCASIMFVFICLLVVMCLVCHGYLHCRRLPWTYDHAYDLTSQTDGIDIDLEKIPSNELFSHVKDDVMLSECLTNLEYPRNDIIFMRDLGHGAFGRVFQAKAPRLIKGTDSTVVAVKMLKEDANDDLRHEFEREAALIAEFKHANIITLLGVCWHGTPKCLLLEYMCHGDLHEFLRLSGPEHYILRRNTGLINRENLENESLDNGTKCYLCEQIAAAMVYLSRRGYIHRDLATRNCLVGNRFTVKMADFGLTRSTDNSECYRGSEHDAIPIRWMPVEAILFNRFTVESDIWSFGVVLWEVFSFAQQPYADLTHEEVIEFVKSGHVMECPIGTPQAVYDLMLECWHHKPSDRPSFTKLHKSLYTQHLRLSKNSKCTNHYHYLEI